MMVFKCDSCKKELTDEQRKGGVRIHHYGMMDEIMLCGKCAKEIIQVLDRKKIHALK